MNLPEQPRKLIFGGVILLSATLAALLVAEVTFRLIPAKDYDPGQISAGLMIPDTGLGWVLQPGFEGQHLHQDFSVTYRVTETGFRKTRPQPLDPSRPVVLILGDSYTFGLGVEDDQTFSSLLSRDYPRKAWVNAGVIGYSNDQQLLFLKRLMALHHYDEVVLCVYLGNDIADNGRPFPLQAARPKPFYRLREGTLTLENVPVSFSRLPPGQRESYTQAILKGCYQPGLFRRLLLRSAFGTKIIETISSVRGDPEVVFEDAHEDEILLFQSIMEEAGRIVHESSGNPMKVILLPGQSLVERPRSFAGQYQEHVRKRIMELDFSGNLTVLDFTSGFRKAFVNNPDKRLFFPNEGHFNRAGHQLFTKIFLASLEK